MTTNKAVKGEGKRRGVNIYTRGPVSSIYPCYIGPGSSCIYTHEGPCPAAARPQGVLSRRPDLTASLATTRYHPPGITQQPPRTRPVAVQPAPVLPRPRPRRCHALHAHNLRRRRRRRRQKILRPRVRLTCSTSKRRRRRTRTSRCAGRGAVSIAYDRGGTGGRMSCFPCIIPVAAAAAARRRSVPVIPRMRDRLPARAYSAAANAVATAGFEAAVTAAVAAGSRRGAAVANSRETVGAAGGVSRNPQALRTGEIGAQSE